MHNRSFSWNALSFYSRIQVFMFLNWKKYFHVFSQHHSDICEKILVVPLLPNFLSSTNQMLLARVSWPVHISQEILSICLSLAINEGCICNLLHLIRCLSISFGKSLITLIKDKNLGLTIPHFCRNVIYIETRCRNFLKL